MGLFNVDSLIDCVHGSFEPYQNGSLVGLFCSMKSDQIQEAYKMKKPEGTIEFFGQFVC